MEASYCMRWNRKPIYTKGPDYHERQDCKTRKLPWYIYIYIYGAECLANIEIGTGEPINYCVPMWSFILSKK